MPIPKIIHQTWKTAEVPERWLSSQRRWQELHPDWEYRLWTDRENRELIKTHYEWFLPTYDGYRYNIQRVDAVRYFILYHFGGVYSDLDVEPLESLAPLFEEADAEILLPKTQNGNTFTNNLMASRQGSRFWEHLFPILVKRATDKQWWRISKHWHVLFSTGPLLIHHAAKTFDGVVAQLPASVSPSGMLQPRPGVHYRVRALEGGSWNAGDTHFFNFLFTHLRVIIALAVILILALFWWFGWRAALKRSQ